MPERLATRLSRRLGDVALRRRPAIKAAMGVSLVLLGGLALTAPTISARVSVRLAGAILLAAGLFQTLLALSAQKDTTARNVAVGLANLIVGLVFLVMYRTSILMLSLVLAATYVVVGAHKAITAYRARSGQWRAMLALGCLLMLFGGLIGARWPGSGLTVIGRFVGINLIIEGVTWLMIVWNGWLAGRGAESPGSHGDDEPQKGPAPK